MNGWGGVELDLDGRVYLRCGSRFEPEVVRVICDRQEIDFAQSNIATIPGASSEC
jgi:hypothetical protein